MPLQTVEKNRHSIVMSRVCDGCFATNQETEEDCGSERRLSDTTPSLVDSETSAKDDLIVEPQHHNHFAMGRSLSTSAVTDMAPRPTPLAPVEDWMDRSGILSLYPLAVQASHSRSRSHRPAAVASPTTARAAGPLFAPSMSERRLAQEKELERVSSRRRRNVCLWISTPVGSDVEDEATVSAPVSPRKPQASGTRTPVERELDWSTF